MWFECYSTLLINALPQGSIVVSRLLLLIHFISEWLCVNSFPKPTMTVLSLFFCLMVESCGIEIGVLLGNYFQKSRLCPKETYKAHC